MGIEYVSSYPLDVVPTPYFMKMVVDVWPQEH